MHFTSDLAILYGTISIRSGPTTLVRKHRFECFLKGYLFYSRFTGRLLLPNWRCVFCTVVLLAISSLRLGVQIYIAKVSHCYSPPLSPSTIWPLPPSLCCVICDFFHTKARSTSFTHTKGLLRSCRGCSYSLCAGNVALAGLSGCACWWAVRWGVAFAGLSDGVLLLLGCRGVYAGGLSGCVCWWAVGVCWWAVGVCMLVGCWGVCAGGL